MKLVFFFLLLSISTAHAGIYAEGEILHPILNLTERTRENTTDLRTGYTWESWDLSARYNNISDIEGSSLLVGTGKAGNATDTYA